MNGQLYKSKRGGITCNNHGEEKRKPRRGLRYVLNRSARSKVAGNFYSGDYLVFCLIFYPYKCDYQSLRLGSSDTRHQIHLTLLPTVFNSGKI